MFLNGKLIPGTEPAKTLVYLTLPLLLLLIVFPAVIQPNQVFISEYHDTLVQLLPEYFLMQHPFALWNNEWLTGLPEIASLNTDRFYPFSFPFLLVFQNIFFINLILLINLYIAFLAFYKLGSLLVKNADLLLIFSIGYMFSGVLMSRVFIGHIFIIYALAWTPLVYYFFLKITYASEPTVTNIIGLTITETILFFTGGLYYFFFCNVIIVIFSLYYVLDKRITRQEFTALSVSLGLFLLLSAVKLIPNYLGTQYFQRIDIINPLGDGGTLENNFASFIFGTPIDSAFGWYETMALIGVIPVLLAILALIWGDRKITAPSFFALVFSLVWADGGRILLSFLHLLPLVNNFRNAGRIFGATTPILLLLAVYGVYLIFQKLKSNESFTVSEEQKRSMWFGIAVIALVKILELPWVTIPSVEAVLSLVLVFGFILMIYLNKTTESSLKLYFGISLLVDSIVIVKNFVILDPAVVMKTALIAIILAAVLITFNRRLIDKKQLTGNSFFMGVLIIGLIIPIAANISTLKVSDPQLIESPAVNVIEKIKEFPQTTPQIWVYEIGWPVKHVDFTYWMIMNNIHPMRAFYSYVPNYTPPLNLQIGDTVYFTADYIIDTAYLENGNQNLNEVTFKTDNISVYKPANVLPNAFVVRNGQLVPAKFEKFTPDEEVLSGQFLAGDIAVLKTAYYPGWKMNGQDTINIGNMPANKLQADSSIITFRYEPVEAKVGELLTVTGIIAITVLFIRRRDWGVYLSKVIKEKPKKKLHTRKKPAR
jgi:hypothetical protein